MPFYSMKYNSKYDLIKAVAGKLAGSQAIYRSKPAHARANLRNKATEIVAMVEG